MPATPIGWIGLLVGVLAVPAPAGGEGSYGDIGDLKLARPEDKADVATVAPPRGAIVLFDGKGLDQWVKTKDRSPASWTLVDGGAMQVGGGGIMTRRAFDGHFRLHVEFRVPYMPRAEGQGRG